MNENKADAQARGDLTTKELASLPTRAALREALAAQARGGEAVAVVRHFTYQGIARNGVSQEAVLLDGAPSLPDGAKLYATQPAPALAREPLSEMQALAMNPYIVGDEVKQALWLSAVRMTERHFGITADSARAE